MVMEFVEHVLVPLWLPILLSAVFCFIAASILWMLAPHHKTEWKSLPGGNEIQDVLRRENAVPGGYLMPYNFDSSKGKDPAFMDRLNAGPLGTVYLRPGGWNMGKTLTLQFLFMLIVSVFVAHEAINSGDPGDQFSWVFHDAAIAAFMAYFLASIPDCIWWGRPWNHLLRQLPDALIYAAITGATFAGLWPAAVH